MAARAPRKRGADGTVNVRLSQIPQTLRSDVAAEIVKRAGARGDDAHAWLVAALAIFGDPVLTVPRWKADLVLAGRQPPGDSVRVWTW